MCVSSFCRIRHSAVWNVLQNFLHQHARQWSFWLQSTISKSKVVSTTSLSLQKTLRHWLPSSAIGSRMSWIQVIIALGAALSAIAHTDAFVTEQPSRINRIYGRKAIGWKETTSRLRKLRFPARERFAHGSILFAERRTNRNRRFHPGDDHESDGTAAMEGRVMPQLLPAGLGSSASMKTAESSVDFTSRPASAPLVASKFELQYTCNICNTRNKHRVSRIACK
jgi:hypothetical protein